MTGQANVIASSTTDTLNLAAGDGMEITTNDGSSEISLERSLERLSKEGFLALKADGTADKMP